MGINLREAAPAKAPRQESIWHTTTGAKRLGWLELRIRGKKTG